HEPHCLQDRQCFADLPAAYGKMLRQLALGRCAVAGLVRVGNQESREPGEKVFFRHGRQLVTECFRTKSSETVMPRPGPSGIAIVPSFRSIVSSIRSCSIGLAPNEYSST